MALPHARRGALSGQAAAVYVGIAIGYVLTGSIKVAFLLPSLLSGLLTILLYCGTWGVGYGTQRWIYGRSCCCCSPSSSPCRPRRRRSMPWRRPSSPSVSMVFCASLLCGRGWRWYWLGWFAAGQRHHQRGGSTGLLVLLPRALDPRVANPRRALVSLAEGLLGPLARSSGDGPLAGPHAGGRDPSEDPLLLAYRDNILLRQTVTRYTSAWHHVKPFWYYLTSVIRRSGCRSPAAALAGGGLAARHSGAGQAYPAAAGLSDAGGAVFFSCSPGKRGVTSRPVRPPWRS